MLGDLISLQAHNDPLLAHQQHLFGIAKDAQTDEGIPMATELEGAASLPGPGLQGELFHGHPFAAAVGRGHQHPRRRLDLTPPRQHVHPDHLITLPQGHGPDAAGCAAHGTQLVVVDPHVNGHPRPGANQHTVFYPRQADPAEGVTGFQADGNQPVGANVGEGTKGGALDEPRLGQHEQMPIFAEVR